jgi:hypothetical protein
MDPAKRPRAWWLPGSLVALVGAFFLFAGLISGGTDRVDGIIIGALSVLVSGVMLWRRAPRAPAEGRPQDRPE